MRNLRCGHGYCVGIGSGCMLFVISLSPGLQGRGAIFYSLGGREDSTKTTRERVMGLPTEMPTRTQHHHPIPPSSPPASPNTSSKKAVSPSRQNAFSGPPTSCLPSPQIMTLPQPILRQTQSRHRTLPRLYRLSIRSRLGTRKMSWLRA